MVTSTQLAESLATPTEPEVTVPLDPNRPATAGDAATLGEVWRGLHARTKSLKQAHSNFAKALATNAYAAVNVADLELEARLLGDALVNARRIIDTLPNGTTAKDGATRQTVILQFFGPVNRDLKARMSSSDAARVNKASFGGK